MMHAGISIIRERRFYIKKWNDLIRILCVCMIVYFEYVYIVLHTVLHTESMTFSIAKMKVALNCFCCVKFDLISFLIEWA